MKVRRIRVVLFDPSPEEGSGVVARLKRPHLPQLQHRQD